MTDGIRVFYRTEPDANTGGVRRVTVAYRHNHETGHTEYGATMFREPGVYVKNKHRKTAEGRLAVRPVTCVVHGENYREVEDAIRLAMLPVSLGGKGLGCRGPRS